LRYVDNEFSDSFISTLGVDFKFKRVLSHGKWSKLQIWDTAGQDKFKTIVKNFYRNTHGCLLVFSLDDKNTFERIKYWMTELENNGPKAICLTLVGNKSDLKRQVSEEEAQKFAQEHHMPYYETSAKTGKGVNDAFQKLVDDMHNGMVSGKLAPLEHKKLEDEPQPSTCWC